MFKESKIIAYLTRYYRKSQLILRDLIKSSGIVSLSLSIRRDFFIKPVKTGCIFLFMVFSINLLLSLLFNREINLLDAIIKSTVLLLSFGGFFCDADWQEVKKTSVILSKIFK